MTARLTPPSTHSGQSAGGSAAGFAGAKILAMSEDLEVSMHDHALPVFPEGPQEEYKRRILEQSQMTLARFLPRAVEVLSELLEGADNERVRLSAAEAIMDRAGLTKSQVTQIQVTTEEHAVARVEADAMVARIAANQAGAIDKPVLSLDAIIVHEGDVEELPVAGPVPLDVLDVQAH